MTTPAAPDYAGTLKADPYVIIKELLGDLSVYVTLTEEAQDRRYPDIRKRIDQALALAAEPPVTSNEGAAVYEALRDFSEIAKRAKPNCGPKLLALIQSAQEKHTDVIARAYQNLPLPAAPAERG